jgi:uroporphyrinogen III methyltransferase/synthase
MSAGFVSLVGAGPGHPGLLTVRGRRALERADVVLYDYLASPALLESVPVPGQIRIHVGKSAGTACASQGDINRLLVERALSGERVVRLKGGDPFIFGRGSEEAGACVDAGLPFEIIPGVSSIHAVPAYAGIPLTDREIASGFTVLTGHERWSSENSRIDWARVAGTDGTIVVLMGVLQIASWTQGLLDAGLDAQTPVALVRWGTTPRQDVLTATLATVAGRVEELGFGPPAVAVVGRTVELREKLAWLKHRPLARTVIGLTRANPPAESTFDLLEDLGAILFHLPMTHQMEIPCAATAIALVDAKNTDVIFTSANGVLFFKKALASAGLDSRDLAGKQVWAVGPATARSCYELLGVHAEHVPESASAEGLVAHAKLLGVEGRGFIFPAAKAARPTLERGLKNLGASIQRLNVYETLPMENAAQRLQDAMDVGLNLVVVASPSAVDALCIAMKAASLPLDALSVAAIGPTTAGHAQKAGLHVVCVPAEHTMAGLVRELAHHYND